MEIRSSPYRTRSFEMKTEPARASPKRRKRAVPRPRSLGLAAGTQFPAWTAVWSGSLARVSSRDSIDALRVDSAAECMWRDGEKVGVPLKAFLVLRRLMERPGQLVTKQDLLEAVWPNTYVTETVLNNAVGQLRQALGDDPQRPRFIEAVHRRGFRSIGPAAADAAPA
jgi:DNA-binding response OmpR family regulator